MTRFAPLLALALLPAFAHAEEAWRWKDANGTLCYSNRAETAPPEAAPVTTRLVIEAAHLPGAEPVTEARHLRPGRRLVPARKMKRIYSEERLRFGCHAANVLYAGGWGHPDDITLVGNCLPYLLGPEAWLNAARAELGLREHGIDWRQLVPMYLDARNPRPMERLTAVSDRE